MCWRQEEALIHVDYSENYNNTQQDEIQRVYSDQQNIKDPYRSN